MADQINSAPCLGATYVMWPSQDLPAPQLRKAEARAKRICARCPDAQFNRCLEQSAGEPYLGGIWAGLTDVERRKHRKAKTLQTLRREEGQTDAETEEVP